jgi:hypothetical protein
MAPKSMASTARSRLRTIGAALLLLLGLAAVLTTADQAAAQDTGSCRFTGTVTLNGEEVPEGTIVRAFIEGNEYEAATPTGYGPSTYSVEITPPEGQHYADGTLVRFTVDGSPADQTELFRAGEHIRLDLTAIRVATPAPTPQSTPTSSDSSASAGWVVLLAFACIAEVSVLGGVAYIAASEWDL